MQGVSDTTCEKISTLLAWCHTNGVKIDSRLSILRRQDGGLGIFSRKDQVNVPATLVQIPKSAVLSVKSCSLSDYITPIPYGHGAHLALSLAVYNEILQGKESRWFGYLQSLPQTLVDIAMFWGRDDIELADVNAFHQSRLLDGKEAIAWLRGTEAQKQLRGSDETGLSLLDETRHYYLGVVVPLLARHRLGDHQSSLSGFCHAYSLVSSRAFLIDAYHGLAMVPIADVFNHAHANHVHLESDYDVCSTCGSFSECHHDSAEDDSKSAGADPSRGTIIPRSEEEGIYEMICDATIAPDCEVFNTYGDKLSNAELLVRYGFMVDGNENDCVTWTVSELVELGREGMAELWAGVVNEWDGEWKESDLVYLAKPVKNKKGGGADNWDLCLNGDCKISHHLWLYCALLNLGDTRVGVKDAAELLRRVADVQHLFAVMSEEGISAVREEESKMVTGTVRTVVALCRSKKANIGKVESSSYELGLILDDLPEDRFRTRMGVVQAMTEMSILESCESKWSEILEFMLSQIGISLIYN